MSMFKALRAYLITGILIITPIALTIYIFWKIFRGLDAILLDGFNNVNIFLGLPTYQGNIPGLGIVAMLVVTVLIGAFGRNYFGNKLFQLSAWTVTKIPLISKIYIALRQLFEAIFAEKREVFQHVVLFEYPRRGMYSIGFVTQDTRGEVQDVIDEDVYSVFLPTTPNPTSGYLLFIPKEEATLLKLSVEDALKLIVSGGAISPDLSPQKAQTLEDLFPFMKRLAKRKKSKKILSERIPEE